MSAGARRSRLTGARTGFKLAVTTRAADQRTVSGPPIRRGAVSPHRDEGTGLATRPDVSRQAGLLLFKGIVSNRREILTPYLVRALTSLTLEEDGQTLVEYALILVLVSTAAFTLLNAIGAFPSSVFSLINTDF